MPVELGLSVNWHLVNHGDYYKTYYVSKEVILTEAPAIFDSALVLRDHTANAIYPVPMSWEIIHG